MGVVFLVLMAAWFVSFLVRRNRRSRYIRLIGEEVSSSHEMPISSSSLTHMQCLPETVSYQDQKVMTYH